MLVFLFPTKGISGDFLRFVVRDSITAAPVSQVIIQNSGGRDLAVTDSSGLAVLPLNQISFPTTLRFYRMDYRPFTLQLRQCPPPDSLFSVALVPSPLPLSPVSVQSELPEVQSDGSVILRPDRLKLVPFSQDDIYRMISIYPAAFIRSDYSSLFYVRGGTPDQNLFYLDDVPILNPYRIRLAMGGGTGILNSTQVSSAEFYPGNFSVAYGRNAGALVNMQSKDCLSDRLRGKFTLSPYESGIQIETPLPFRLKVNTAARVSFLDWVIKKLDYANVIRPRFQDIQGNIVWQPNKSHHLKFGFMYGTESVFLDMSDNLVVSNSRYRMDNRGKSKLLYLRHQWQLNPRFIFINIIAFNRMQIELEDNYFKYDPTNHEIKKYGNDLDLQHARYLIRQLFSYTTAHFTLKSGLGLELNHTRSEVSLGVYPFAYYMNSFFSQDSFFYMEHFSEAKIAFSKFHFTVGYRAESDQFYKSPLFLAPRAGLTYRVTPILSINARSGIYYQFPFQDAMAFRQPPVNVFAYDRNAINHKHLAEKFIKNELGIHTNSLYRTNAAVVLYHLYSGNMLTSFKKELISGTQFYTNNGGKLKSYGIEFWSSTHFGQNFPRMEVFFSAAYHHSRVFRDRVWLRNPNDFVWNFQLINYFKPVSWFRFGTMLNYYRIPDRPSIYRFLLMYAGTFPPDIFPSIIEEDYFANIDYFRWDVRLQFLLKGRLFFTLDFINITNHKNLYMTTFFDFKDSEETVRLGISRIYNIPFLVFGGLHFSF